MLEVILACVASGCVGLVVGWVLCKKNVV